MTPQAKSAIVAWVAAVAGPINPIWADQNAPAPGTAYITLRPSTSTRQGEDYVGAPNDAGVTDIVGNREYVLYIQGFGPGTFSALEALRDSLFRPSIQDTFREAGLAYIDSEDVMNLTQLIEITMNERCSLDVRFRTNSTVQDGVGVIGNADIEGLIDVEALILEVNETDLLVNSDQMEIVSGSGFAVKINVET